MPNPYQLRFPSHLGLDLSVHHFTLDEALDTPYLLNVTVTSADPALPLASLIHQPVSFTITPPSLNPLPSFPGLPSPPADPALQRVWHGLVCEAWREDCNVQETRYRFAIGPRLSLLADGCTCRLFQNSTVQQVIGAVLQQHGFAASEVRFQLTSPLPTHAHLTQWRESDLQFISRLAAEAGLFYQFVVEEADKELLLFGDNLEHYGRGRLLDIPLRQAGGLRHDDDAAIQQWQIHHRSMLHSVRRTDFNYLTADTVLDAEQDFSGPQQAAAYGLDYAWGEGGRDATETARIAQLRHQASQARQCVASGSGTVLHIRPGEVLRLQQAFDEAPHGWLIIAARHQGARDQAYHNTFQAIPADRIWRPARQAKPRIHGTLPAMVVSPADNSYRYPFLDELGRYRVRFLFDLDRWSPGGDSRPVRLAKPFAGGGFGFHLPLHAGTRVNLGFDDGDPDHPYIASVLHDSSKPDHINSGWNTRNVILTRSHNKLRMEDLQGKEHIKLATEYGKAQLNIGHLVDAQRQPRGEGFELHSDQWGAIRAGKGLLLSAHAQPGAGGLQREMAQTVQQLERANQSIDSLNAAASSAKADPVQLQAQLDLLSQQVKDLQQAVLLASAPAGMALTSGGSLHAAAGQDMALTAQRNVGVSAMKSLMVNIGQAISLFAAKAGIKLYANQGKVDIQAQNNNLLASAGQDMHLSAKGTLVLAADKIILKGGGAALRLSAEGVEAFSPGKLALYGDLDMEGPKTLSHAFNSIPKTAFDDPYIVQHQTTGKILPNVLVQLVRSDGTVMRYRTGADGSIPVQKSEVLEALALDILTP